MGGVVKGKFSTKLKHSANYDYAIGYNRTVVSDDFRMEGTGNGYLPETGLRGEYLLSDTLLILLKVNI